MNDFPEKFLTQFHSIPVPWGDRDGNFIFPSPSLEEDGDE